ncbi:TetR-like C-terminal domain-containing protein [Sediminicoccus sp. KRV36]|uniref:TetR/AcrR family transcriptional regulator n=1 Tax=Sediminicoccus sp. KRV36 TaxID=3133721 RepID=UPI00200EF018|nr:TetR-like C-terminal domain-containing protein [Sediminicoccus rosea]UPY37281.1 WHG domain-containing protein [Sediminicoccus rosea]
MSTLEKPYHHGDLRTALLDAADALLDQGGDGAVSLREAARMAGVSPTAAYRHFADKDALLAALALRGFEAFGAAMAAAVARGDVTPYVARGRAYIRFALARPGRFRLMFGPLLARSGAHPALLAASRQAFAALQASTGEKDAALRGWGMVHGLAHLLLDGAIREEGSMEALVDRLIC